MNSEIIELAEDLSSSPLYSADLAPVPKNKRTWNMWSLAALWVGMAVCIPTYILASYMIKSGLSWQASLIIIGLANILVTIPMVLNGHVGVKYGIPFPVFGRASFGITGIHLVSILRAVVACGWFGVQTWIGGLAFYAIWNSLTGSDGTPELSIGKFVCFGLFWLVNMYFIWKGTESIKWLENLSAPILIIIGVVLIAWSANKAGGFGIVLDQGEQLGKPSVVMHEINGAIMLQLNPLLNPDGSNKAAEFQVSVPLNDGSRKALGWIPILNKFQLPEDPEIDKGSLAAGKKPVVVQFRTGETIKSSIVNVSITKLTDGSPSFLSYILWLTAMVGFWATMSLSISDITRYASRQKDQVAGQFLGLPGAMVLYSFVGIFVTCATVINFKDILIADDAPWDPVSLLAKLESPTLVIVSQIFMIMATLTTNIAANVIAPANAFSNLSPKKISFFGGGVITGFIGIIICPWWLLNEISSILIFVSGALGPVLGILVCDYYLIKKTSLNLAALYKIDSEYAYGGRNFNPFAMVALAAGVLSALIGYWIPALEIFYHLSWFTGVLVSGGIYYLLMKSKIKQ
ncbi:NCS1 family nucleobase:cation symporter-1 [bacterium]|nr:NCS1 family nucleobase:cation symporter-1 [bacterium]